MTLFFYAILELAPTVNPETVFPEELAEEVGTPPTLKPLTGVPKAPVP